MNSHLRTHLWRLVLCLSLLISLPAHAQEAASLAQDPALEQRLVNISAELRCLVCQNESLAGSKAELAGDLRHEIRLMLQRGQSDAEIMEFMVSRYGDFVRYRPPLNPTTWALWFGPALIFIIALGALFAYLRRRNQGFKLTNTSLSATEQSRADQLLGKNSHD